jgi:hypothetical protein
MTGAGQFPMAESDSRPPPFELFAGSGSAAAARYVRVATGSVGARGMCSSRVDRQRADVASAREFMGALARAAVRGSGKRNSFGRHGGVESPRLQRIRSTLWRESGRETTISSIRQHRIPISSIGN